MCNAEAYMALRETLIPDATILLTNSGFGDESRWTRDLASELSEIHIWSWQL